MLALFHRRLENVLTFALFALVPTERKKITTVTAPVGAHDRGVLETVGNAVVEFCFVRICFRIGLGDALGNNLGVTLLVASISAIRTLHTRSIFEEVSTKGASHDVVKLLLDELVTILLVYIFLSLANSAFATKA